MAEIDKEIIKIRTGVVASCSGLFMKNEKQEDQRLSTGFPGATSWGKGPKLW